MLARALWKTLVYRVTASFLTFVAALYFTSGDYRIAAYLAVADFFTKSVLYYVFEVVWNYKTNLRRPP